MPVIATFEQWKAGHVQAMERDNPEVECPFCQGEGTTPVNDWCGCCDGCHGYGTAEYLDVADQYDAVHFTQAAYVREVKGDLGQFCRYTGADFLGAIGQFVKEHRGAAQWQ